MCVDVSKLGWIIRKRFSLTRAKGAVRRHSQAGFATESVRSLIRVLAVLRRLCIKSRLYLEWMHSSRVSTVSVRWLKVFSRLPVVSVFQPNRVTLAVLMKGNYLYTGEGLDGASCFSPLACRECSGEREVTLWNAPNLFCSINLVKKNTQTILLCYCNVMVNIQQQHFPPWETISPISLKS